MRITARKTERRKKEHNPAEMDQEKEVQNKLGHHSMEWDPDFVETTPKSGLMPISHLLPGPGKTYQEA